MHIIRIIRQKISKCVKHGSEVLINTMPRMSQHFLFLYRYKCFICVLYVKKNRNVLNTVQYTQHWLKVYLVDVNMSHSYMRSTIMQDRADWSRLLQKEQKKWSVLRRGWSSSKDKKSMQARKLLTIHICSINMTICA